MMMFFAGVFAGIALAIVTVIAAIMWFDLRDGSEDVWGEED